MMLVVKGSCLMIPESEYKTGGRGPFQYVTPDQVLEHHPDTAGSFFRWMEGQTTALSEDGVSEIYVWDYERWVNKQPIID